jgi:hypothetical protein
MVEPGEILERRRDLDASVRAPEADPMTRVSRLQVQANRLSGMKPDAGASHGVSESSAVGHALSEMIGRLNACNSHASRGGL